MEEFLNDFDDWMCGVCREGDANYGPRTLHAYNQHEFHTTCLNRVRERDARCPICRYPANSTPPYYSQVSVFLDSQTSEASPVITPDSQTSPVILHGLGWGRSSVPSFSSRRRVLLCLGHGIGVTSAYCQQMINETYHAQPF